MRRQQTAGILVLAYILTFTPWVYSQEPDFPDNIREEFQETETQPNNNQNGDLNTNNQNATIDSNNSSTTNIGAGSGSPTPVNTAVGPSLISNGSDSCLKSRSAGVQVLTLGVSGGYYKQDEECNRRRDARLFKDLGMSIASVARMCQNDDNWRAMFSAGTPCPILVDGKMVFGKNAVLVMKTNPIAYIPDYDDKMEYYNTILGIGKENPNENKTTDSSNNISVSDRFRSSTNNE